MIDNAGILGELRESCESCGTRGALVFAGLRDHMFGSPGEWNLRRCTSAACGLVWLDPKPLPEQLGKLYSAYYTHSATGSAPPPDVAAYRSRGVKRLLKSALGVLFFWKRDIFRSDFLHLEGMPPGALLEIGCGDGTFLAAAARNGWCTSGLDFDAAAVAAARQRGVDAQVGELTSGRYAAESFDAIVMNNVIEHLWNPRETLAECHRLLRPGGRLVMVTPNFDSLGRRRFGRNWRGLEPPRHLYLYTARSLRSLCRRAGFRHLQSGSSAGGVSGRGILAASIDIARKAGDATPAQHVDIRQTLAREYVSSLTGGLLGEWVVVIAQRAAT